MIANLRAISSCLIILINNDIIYSVVSRSVLITILQCVLICETSRHGDSLHGYKMYHKVFAKINDDHLDKDDKKMNISFCAKVTNA